MKEDELQICSQAKVVTSDDLFPRLPLEAARDVIEGRFALDATLKPLRSERDQLYLAQDALGHKSIVRIVSAEMDGPRLALQAAALASVASVDPSLPTPRLLPSSRGRAVENLIWNGTEYGMALFSFLEGIPVSDTTRTDSQRRNIGSALARLDKALLSCDHPVPPGALLWDMTKATEISPFSNTIEDGDLRLMVRGVFDDFETRALPVLNRLPHQLIHNDFHAGNVLVDSGNQSLVTGIIDFGDIVKAPRIIDLAVAVARHTSETNPVAEGAQIVMAYHSQSPLVMPEVEILYDLACTRLAMRIAIWSWRLGRGDPRADVKIIRHAADWLAMFQKTGRDAACRVFGDACGF